MGDFWTWFIPTIVLERRSRRAMMWLASNFGRYYLTFLRLFEQLYTKYWIQDIYSIYLVNSGSHIHVQPTCIHTVYGWSLKPECYPGLGTTSSRRCDCHILRSKLLK